MDARGWNSERMTTPVKINFHQWDVFVYQDHVIRLYGVGDMRVIWNNCRIRHRGITARINRVASATAVVSSADDDNPRSSRKVLTKNDLAGASLN